MIKYCHKFFFLFSVIGFSLSLHAQNIKSFTHEPAKFQEELLKFMDSSSKKKESGEFAGRFPGFWLSQQLTDDERQTIYETCDLFLDRKARSFPDFYNYFEVLFAFRQQNRPETDCQNWEKGLLRQMQNKNTKLSKIRDFLVQTQNLLKDNVIHKSHPVEWKAKNANFRYKFDKELTIEFSQADLYCFARRDSSCINETGGVYFPFEKIWKGNKGKITWERAGKKRNEEYAIFDSYTINATKSSFDVDTVYYFNKKLFPGEIIGKLSDKVNFVKDPAKAIYPRFKSFNKEIKIDSLFEHLSYKGGIAIQGTRFIGKGSSQFPAEIRLSRNDTLFVIAKSEHFAFQNNRITAANTQIEVLIDTCRIYHPGLLFKYFTKRKELNLIRTGAGIANSPYINNYHKLIMDFELLNWKLNENKMFCGNMKGAGKRQARFESINYFNANHYMRLQGLDHQNPLVLLRKFADYMYVETFTISEYANYIKKPVNQVRQQLIGLSFQAFVSYNPNTDEITLQKRLNDYIKSGMGKKDYDVIRFSTQTESNTADAILSIDNSNLQINGVKYFTVSDSQNVMIFPKDKKLIFKKDLDFQFDGKVMAGLLDFYGKDFHFSYNNFKIDLNLIDSMQISILNDSLSNYTQRYTDELGSVLEKITGDLLIDDPANKSGNEDFPEYPIFNSTDTSYVYYDNKNVQDSAYKREKFYFKVDPYTFNNINSFKKEDIKFSGSLISAGIFPAFKETVTIQDDKSLGFCHVTPEAGFQTYAKGVFTDTIYLSNKGLRGNGQLNCLASTTVSKDFVFRPEEMLAHAKSFELKEQANRMNNPKVSGDSIYAKWLPYNDTLFVESNSSPLDMYKNEVALDGMLKITPEGITGEGKMNLTNAEVQSTLFVCNRKSIQADTASFKLLNPDDNGYSFETNSVSANIDFDTRSGFFETTSEQIKSYFPVNQYLSFINGFTWHMDQEVIAFGEKDENVLASLWKQGRIEELAPTSYNRFISTDPSQDSLVINTPLAKYNFVKHSIETKFVKSLDIADARIFPDHGNLNIRKGGMLDTLQNAIVVADTTNKYHYINNASINIPGKQSYSGSGDYTYTNENGQAQNIFFETISVDSLGQTFALGNLSEENSFSLSPDFDYKGKVRLEAKEQMLYFDGQTRIHNKCDQINDSWMGFASGIDPNNILIPVGLDTISANRAKTYSSFFLTNDSIHIYSSFLSQRRFYSDNVVLEAEGFLTYNKRLQAYQIAPTEKLKNNDAPGNMVTFYQNNCNIKGEGKIDLGANLGRVEQISAGNIEHSLSSNIITLDLTLGMDFFFSDKALKLMEKTFAETELKGNNINRRTYARRLSDIIGCEKAQKAMQKMDANGIFKSLPKELQHTIYFNNLSFIWDKEAKAYQSVGDIAIGNINGRQLNKLIKGKIELNKKRSGNRLTMYLKLDKSTWFFFEYHHGVLFARSSNAEFNNILHEIKEEKRHVKARGGKRPYSYILSPRSKKTRFVKRFNL